MSWGHSIKENFNVSKKRLKTDVRNISVTLHWTTKEKKYIQELVLGSSLLRSEVDSALREMNKGKPLGGHGIAVKILSALGEFGITSHTDLNRIYDK